MHNKRGLTSISDYELLYMIRQKDDFAIEYMLRKYHQYLRVLILEVFGDSSNIDFDELYSISKYKLYEATTGYCDDKGATFYTYLSICVVRKLKNIKRTIYRERKKIGVCWSLDSYVSEDKDMYLVDTIENNQELYKPTYYFDYVTSLQYIKEFSHSLNEFELSVLRMMTTKNTYSEAAELLNITKKQYDNALYRIRKKLANYLSEIHK